MPTRRLRSRSGSRSQNRPVGLRLAGHSTSLTAEPGRVQVSPFQLTSCRSDGSSSPHRPCSVDERSRVQVSRPARRGRRTDDGDPDLQMLPTQGVPVPLTLSAHRLIRKELPSVEDRGQTDRCTRPHALDSAAAADLDRATPHHLLARNL